MTTIVFRDGALAADSRAYSGDKIGIGSKTKIHRLEDGSLVGCATTEVGFSERFVAWLKAGKPDDFVVPNEIDFQALHVQPDGGVFYYHNSYFPTGPLEAEFFAIGSGAQFALGAMQMGAGAIVALEVACELDLWSDLPLMVLHLKQ